MQKKVPSYKETSFSGFFNLNLLAFCLLISFVILALYAKNYPYFSIDLLITKSIQNIKNPLFDALMRFITRMGDVDWGLLSVSFFVLTAYFFRKTKEALMILISTIGAATLSTFTKNIIARPRPDPYLINQVEVHFKNDSFPSGHVLFYIGLYGFLFFLTFTMFKKSFLRDLFSILFLSLVVLIGLSRIYLGAHWFSDALGSYIIGLLWILLMSKTYKRLIKKNKG